MATDYNTNLPGPIATGPAPPTVHLAWAVYNPMSPNGLVAGQQCALQCDGNGNLLVNVVAGGGGGGGGGGSVTQGTVPWVDNITQWASVALGAPSAYGTSPGAVNVPGVNAFVTNTVSVSLAANQTIIPGAPVSGLTTLYNITTSSSGWTSLVTGVAAQTIRLMRMVLSVSATTVVEIGDGTNVFGGPYYLNGGGSITLDDSGEPWFKTGSGASLEVNSSNAVAITVTVWVTQS